jgi:hypothetical protein
MGKPFVFMDICRGKILIGIKQRSVIDKSIYYLAF